ncbi:MAG: serine/threonine-protein phosphatase [Planctomycetales bacterium]|nr:serine/threonine-protein phosphatase [Planctomycetales bacterium]
MSRPNLKFNEQAPGIACAAVSDVGMRRNNNQDSLAITLAPVVNVWRQRGHLFVVADGMGAHAAGELASQIATENIPLTYYKLKDHPPAEAIVAAVEDANNRIHQRGKDSVDFHGMGTTCSCLLLLPEGAVAAHVGDSRVYRLRNAQLEQLTFDHSLVWEMGAAAQATEEQVPAYVPRNVITRSLGPHPVVKVDVEGPLPTLRGDRFLLCSDGLTGPLTPELIGMVIHALAPGDAAQTLVDLANLLGGPDNISVIVVEAANLSRIEGNEGDESQVDPAAETGVWVSWERYVSPAALIGAGAAAAGAAALASFGMVWAALATSAAALGLAWLGVSSRRNDDGWGGGYVHLRPSGKGPYRRYDVAPNGQRIEVLGEIVRQIEDLEAQQEWGFDWTPIHEDRISALQAVARGDFSAAVSHYCSTVRRLMKALRETQNPGPSDSTINLDED